MGLLAERTFAGQWKANPLSVIHPIQLLTWQRNNRLSTVGSSLGSKRTDDCVILRCPEYIRYFTTVRVLHRPAREDIALARAPDYQHPFSRVALPLLPWGHIEFKGCR